MATLAYQFISKEVKNYIFKHNSIFRQTCINNPHWQSSEIEVFLCKYYIVISDTMVGSFLDVLFLLLAVKLAELSWENKKERMSYEKKYKENLCEGHQIFDCTPYFLWHILVAWNIWRLQGLFCLYFFWHWTGSIWLKSRIFISYTTCCYWLECYLVSKSVGITKFMEE